MNQHRLPIRTVPLVGMGALGYYSPSAILEETWLAVMRYNVGSVAQWLVFAYVDQATAARHGCNANRWLGAKSALRLIDSVGSGEDWPLRVKSALVNGWGNGQGDDLPVPYPFREQIMGDVLRTLNKMRKLMGLPDSTPLRLELVESPARPVQPIQGLAGKSPVFSSGVEPSFVESVINRLKRDLGSVIANAAELSGAPVWLLSIIAAKEIQFKPYTTTNPVVKATGPAQVTPSTMYDVYYVADKLGFVTPQVNALLKSKMGSYWLRFQQLASNRQAEAKPYTVSIRLLRDPELNLTMAGLLLSCLIRTFGGEGMSADQARVVLGYNMGIGWSLQGLAKALKIDQGRLIKRIARPDWVFPVHLRIAPQTLMASMAGPEQKKYIAEHLAPGGYFEQAVRLGITPSTAL